MPNGGRVGWRTICDMCLTRLTDSIESTIHREDGINTKCTYAFCFDRYIHTSTCSGAVSKRGAFDRLEEDVAWNRM